MSYTFKMSKYLQSITIKPSHKSCSICSVCTSCGDRHFSGDHIDNANLVLLVMNNSRVTMARHGQKDGSLRDNHMTTLNDTA